MKEDEIVKSLIKEEVPDWDDLPAHLVEQGVKCLDCLKADILLKMALSVARGRLLGFTNAEHDKTFDKIARYLDKKYPKREGCPGLD